MTSAFFTRGGSSPSDYVGKRRVWLSAPGDMEDQSEGS